MFTIWFAKRWKECGLVWQLGLTPNFGAGLPGFGWTAWCLDGPTSTTSLTGIATGFKINTWPPVFHSGFLHYTASSVRRRRRRDLENKSAAARPPWRLWGCSPAPKRRPAFLYSSQVVHLPQRNGRLPRVWSSSVLVERRLSLLFSHGRGVQVPACIRWFLKSTPGILHDSMYV